MALPRDDQRRPRGEGGHDRPEPRGGEALCRVVEGQPLGGQGGVEPLGGKGQAQLAVARPRGEAGPLGAPHDALHLGIARVAESLGEPHHGGRAAVRGARDLVRREQGDVREVVRQVAGERLLGGAEALVVALESLGECVDVGGHAPSFRRRAPVPYRRRAVSVTDPPRARTIRTEPTASGAAPSSTT